MWTYYGVDVFPADRNSSGIRWYARTPAGILRADTKESMRQLIRESLK
jgi:Leu/Phe-tRNA-protein transferase